MSAALTNAEDQQDFMGIGAVDTDVIDTLLESVEDMLERACDRAGDGLRARPFQRAEGGREEVHDGVESDTLYLDYPIDSITSITLGLDVNDPDEELDPDDVQVVVWGEGKRKLQRVDGCTFGPCYPRYVHIEYEAQADLPAVAKLAVQSVTAMLYRRRGSEDAKSESLGDFSHTMATLKDDVVWQAAVEQCRGVIV